MNNDRALSIYKIANIINDKCYIGLTTLSIEDRFETHKRDTKAGSQYLLHKAMRKYGSENFNISLIGGANSFRELSYQEWLLIHINQTLSPNGYNLKEGGSRGSYKWTNEQKNKHSTSMKNRNFVTWNKGTKGIMKSNSTTFTSKSTGGENNPFFGKKHREESVIKRLVSLGRDLKPFLVLNKEMEVLGKWIIQSEASRDLEIPSDYLTRGLCKKEVMVGDFYISYEDNLESIQKYIDNKNYEEWKKRLDKEEKSRRKKEIGHKAKLYNNRLVECIETKEIFKDIYAVCKKYKMIISNALLICNAKKRAHKGLSFEFVDDKDKIEKRKTRSEMIKKIRDILCIENGMVFKTSVEASLTLNIGRSAIGNMLAGLSKTAGGMSFRYI